jgi:hypothetical protein
VSSKRERRRFVNFDLLIHFLNERRLFFELSLNGVNFLLLSLHGGVLFEKLIEQHRVHRLVAHAVRPALAIACHQVRVDLPLAQPVTLPLSATGFYYSNGLIGSDISQFLPGPAWPLDGQGTYASCLT